LGPSEPCASTRTRSGRMTACAVAPAAAGTEPDVVSTAMATAILKKIGQLDAAKSRPIALFVASLQSYESGAFKLKKGDGAGHHVNTYYALETLETLGQMSVLEDTLRLPEHVVNPPKYVPYTAFLAAVVLSLLSFVGLLYVVTRGSSVEEEEEPEEESETEKTEGEEKEGEEKGESKEKGEDKKGKKEKPKKKKVEPTITIYRNNDTREYMDKDGESFPTESLNTKEWQIIEQKEIDGGKRTEYIIRKVESYSTPHGGVTKRRNKRK